MTSRAHGHRRQRRCTLFEHLTTELKDRRYCLPAMVIVVQGEWFIWARSAHRHLLILSSALLPTASLPDILQQIGTVLVYTDL